MNQVAHALVSFGYPMGESCDSPTRLVFSGEAIQILADAGEAALLQGQLGFRHGALLGRLGAGRLLLETDDGFHRQPLPGLEVLEVTGRVVGDTGHEAHDAGLRPAHLAPAGASVIRWGPLGRHVGPEQVLAVGEADIVADEVADGLDLIALDLGRIADHHALVVGPLASVTHGEDEGRGIQRARGADHLGGGLDHRLAAGRVVRWDALHLGSLDLGRLGRLGRLVLAHRVGSDRSGDEHIESGEIGHGGILSRGLRGRGVPLALSVIRWEGRRPILAWRATCREHKVCQPTEK